MSKNKTQGDIGEITCGPSTTSIEWKIYNYFELFQELKYGLKSPTFGFLDATWYLRWCHYEEHSPVWISLYLIKEHSESRNHQTQFTMGIRERDGSKVTDRRLDHTFEENGDGFGWCNYIKVSQLKQRRKEFAPAGVLTVFCTMSANTQRGVQAAVQTETPLDIEKLAYDFKDLLVSGEATDVTLKVQDREYKVHSAVLTARSAVFGAMMRHDWKEKNSRIVQIDDCDPSAFLQFLTYLYSGHVEDFSPDLVIALHTIADKYDAQELKAYCIEFMMKNMSVEIFCDVVSLSLRYDESELLEESIVFFVKNLVDILITPKWLSFAKENPVQANELHIKAAKYFAKNEESTSP